jgi:hypothetical protein
MANVILFFSMKSRLVLPSFHATSAAAGELLEFSNKPEKSDRKGFAGNRKEIANQHKTV